MAQLSILSLNCHGFNMGTLCYLRDKCSMFDIMLLQETWLSNESSKKLDDISSDFNVIHSSAMENKMHDEYLSGRPFGGTAVLYNKRLPCTVTKLDTNYCRCTTVKLAFNRNNDLVVFLVFICLTLMAV